MHRLGQMNVLAAQNGEFKSGPPRKMPKSRSTAGVEDLTPMPSRTSSPADNAGVTNSDVPSIQTQRAGSTDVYVSFVSKLATPLPSRTSTPRNRPLSAADVNMSSSFQPANSSSNEAHSSGAHRQQQPQQQPQQSRQTYTTATQHQQPYYTAVSPTSESGYRNSPSISSASTPLFAQQRAAGFVGQYAVPAPLAPPIFASQYSYPPQAHHPGLHSPAHTTPEYYTHRHSVSLSHSQSPIYVPTSFAQAPAVHTSVPPEHTQTPALAFDYDFDGGAGRSPAAGSPYTSQQSFPAFNYHPTLTATPRFAHSHSSFGGPFQPHQHQPQLQPPYQHSYAYLATPSSPEDPTQGSGTWWYIPQPPSASPTVGPYQSMYYLDAYGNPSGAGIGPKAGLPAAQSPSPARGSVPPSVFSLQETSAESGSGAGGGGMGKLSSGVWSGAGPGIATALWMPHHASASSSRPASTTSSSHRPLSPSPLALGESTSEQPHLKHAGQGQAQRRAYHPNPPTNRSEWVMWVGNVPSDSTYDELWRFFTQPLTPSGVVSSPTLPRQGQPPLLPAGLLSPTGSSTDSDAGASANVNGVASVFLIARSSCAFVNYASALNLQAAISRFNGIPLRPGDARCPRLVCRVRGKDEDLRAGVGGQRGRGLHVRWIKEQRERERQTEMEQKEVKDPPATPSSSIDNMESVSSQAESAEHGRSPPHHSSSSGSTTSSFLTRHFPKRYFILKSLTQFDLDLSVKRGLWATQPHNEGVLNQAYGTSTEVFLIFGVNKSGEFFGYAKMAGSIAKSEERILWACRGDSHSPAASFSSSAAGRSSQVSETIPEEKEGSFWSGAGDSDKLPNLLFSPSEHRLADHSPGPITPHEQQRLTATESGEPNMTPPFDGRSGGDKKSPSVTSTDARIRYSEPASAPAEMGHPYRRITLPRERGPIAETMDPRLPRRDLPIVELDPESPFRAFKDRQAHGPNDEAEVKDADHMRRGGTVNVAATVCGAIPATHRSAPFLSAKDSRPEDAGSSSLREGVAQAAGESEVPAQWGTPFKVEWLRVERLPFHRTRHLRNPWNHEREVKVSRDGTELEPGVGQALLDEWDKDELPQAALSQPTAAPTVPLAVGRRGGQFRRAQA